MTPDGPGSPPATAKPRTQPWRHVLNGALLVVFLVIAGIVLHTAPSEEQWQAAIPVTGEVGQTVAGRNIRATVTEVRVADTVTASNGWSGETSGIWVVVDASVEAVLTDYGVSLGTAQLKIGGTLYAASERPDRGSIEGTVLSVGIPQTGPLMFEVPREVLGGDAARSVEIQLAANDDPRTDSMVVVPVDLTAVPRLSAVTTDKPVWGLG
ncbi:MAG: hypothetical protein JWR01_2293 [Subtercola sp.]|nr:hypothetical protein [Subtercola sp.]